MPLICTAQCSALRIPLGKFISSQSPAFRSLHSAKWLDAPTSQRGWLQCLPASAIGLSVGSAATVPSVLGPSLCKAQGVLVSTAADFSMSHVLMCTTMMPLTAGVAAATLAPYAERFGVRRFALLSSIGFPLGLFVLPSVALDHNSFSCFFASYTLLGGLGFYSSYHQMPPHLGLRWFPENQGFALSLFFISFGGGALLAVPALRTLLATFRRAPTYVGSWGEISLITAEDGRRLVVVDGESLPAVVATARDLAEAGFAGIPEGVYLLGGGSSGAGEAMLCLGATTFAALHCAAWGLRVPPAAVLPAAVPSASVSSVSVPAVSVPAASESITSLTTASETATQPAALPATPPTIRHAIPLTPHPEAGTHQQREALESQVPLPPPPLPPVLLADAMLSPRFYLLFCGSFGVSMVGLPFIHAGG